MSLLDEIRRRSRSVIWPVICALLMVYYGYHLLEGERGLKAWWRLNQEIAIASGTRDDVKAERIRLATRVSLLRKDSLDADLLGERARRMLNVMRRDEIVIFYDRPLGAKRTTPQTATN